LKSAGGYFTNSSGEEYLYYQDLSEFPCDKGVVGALNKEIYTKVLQDLTNSNANL